MIADATRAHIPVELDRTRILCFDHKATFALTQRYGLRSTAALYESVLVSEKPKRYDLRIRDIDALTFFLWVGLKRDAEDAGEALTLDRAEEFITPLTIEPIFQAMLAALSRPLHRKNAEPAEPKGGQAGESESPKQSTGSRPFGSQADGSD